LRVQACAQLAGLGKIKQSTCNTASICFDCTQPRDCDDPIDPPEDPEKCKINPDSRPEEYLVFMPGFLDVVKIPGTISPELKMQQIRRMFAAKTTVPEPVRWIPAAINMLDDAQDLLFTVLSLGKPLLRRLPLRFIPAIGWALFANDVLNITTSLLATALASRSFKKASLKSILWMWTRRNRRVRAVRHFLSHTNYFSVIVQGLQVSRDWTGVGLQLGGIMGFVVDAIWTPLRMAQGAKVELVIPPSDDPLVKAAKLMAQHPEVMSAYDIFTPDEHYMLELAFNVATQLLTAAVPPSILEARGPELGELSYPTFIPTNTSTLYALQKEKVLKTGLSNDELCEMCNNGQTYYAPSIDTEEGPSLKSYLPFPYDYPPIGDVIKSVGDQAQIWENAMAELHGQSGRGATFGWLHNVWALEMLNWQASDLELPPKEHAGGTRQLELLSDPGDAVEHLLEPFELEAARAIEFSIFPAGDITPAQMQNFADIAQALANSTGHKRATFEQQQKAAIEAWGGFVRRPYATFEEGK
jgi:hypothetical protein